MARSVRRPADLRRRPEARRALRHRRAPGPALHRRRIPAQRRRLRNLCARPLAAGPFRRQGLRAAAPGPAGRAAHHGQHRQVAIDVYRVGDRNLLARPFARRLPESHRQFPRHRDRQFRTASRSGAARWTSPPNSTRTSSPTFPFWTRSASSNPASTSSPRGPGKATARRKTEATTERDALATQWLVVSDLGLTALSGEDGVHAIVHSLATGGAARRRRGQADRAQQRNIGDQIDRRGRPRRFRSRPVARDRRLVAGLLVATTLADDYGFLNLVQNAFDLTDRGVGGRDAPGALDAFLFTERGVYRSGETVLSPRCCATPRARPRPACR
jgi:hypothetical protein